jgi:DNA-binding NarL/FixJ family response regulator
MPTLAHPDMRLLIVDDHAMLLDSFVRVLSDEPGMTVVATATTIAETYFELTQHAPDVVVLDSRLPDGDGLTAARRILAEPDPPIVVFVTGFPDVATVQGALSAGCSAVVSKDRGARELLAAIRDAARGIVTKAVPEATLDTRASDLHQLSPRELDVLQCMAAGQSTQDMSDALFISRNTVRTHVQRILDKLKAHSKLEAVVIARRNGIL